MLSPEWLRLEDWRPSRLMPSRALSCSVQGSRPISLSWGLFILTVLAVLSTQKLLFGSRHFGACPFYVSSLDLLPFHSCVFFPATELNASPPDHPSSLSCGCPPPLVWFLLSPSAAKNPSSSQGSPCSCMYYLGQQWRINKSDPFHFSGILEVRLEQSSVERDCEGRETYLLIPLLKVAGLLPALKGVHHPPLTAPKYCI